MAGELFVDTSAWYPLVVGTHPDHDRLSAALRRVVGEGQQVVTTNLVVAETHALLLRRVHRQVALTFVRTVHEPPNIVVRSNEELEAAAMTDWLAAYDDQDFSFADAVSFATMKDRGIRVALTLDRHFVTAGFALVRTS